MRERFIYKKFIYINMYVRIYSSEIYNVLISHIKTKKWRATIYLMLTVIITFNLVIVFDCLTLHFDLNKLTLGVNKTKSCYIYGNNCFQQI